MHPIAHFAAGIILTSALGAFILCLLVIRYGFTPAEDEPPPVRHRRFFVTRLGHAAGAVCFAITAGLAAVALSVTARPPASAAPPPTVDVAPLQAGHARLTHDVRSLDERIERTEAALAELRAAVTARAAVATAASRPDVLERPARPPRRPVARVARPADDARASAPSATAPSDGQSADAMPRASTNFSASHATVAEEPPSAPAPTDELRSREPLRVAADRIARLGTEIKEKAVTATRAVRDFFREL